MSLESMHAELRDVHHIQEGIDYAVVAKCGETRIMCAGPFVLKVQGVAYKHGVRLVTTFTYEYDGRHAGVLTSM